MDQVLSGFGYFPPEVRGPYIKINKYRSFYFYKYNYQKYDYIGTIVAMPKEKNRYRPDKRLSGYLEHAGIDLIELRKMYKLTPASVESVYKDFEKYLIPINFAFRFTDDKLVAMEMLAAWKNKPGKRARLLNYDEAISYIDRSKSATAFFNRVYKNKGEVIDSPNFKESFIHWIMGLINNDEQFSAWLTCMKEEIRDSLKIDELKIRSFIISSIFEIILNHMLNLEGDLIITENWYKLRTGMGMALFYRNYHKMMSRIIRRLFFGFYDVGKFDSRMNHNLKGMEIDAHSTMYTKHTVMLSEFLGGPMYELAKKLGYKDIPVHCNLLRHRLIRSETEGPVILPHGELMFKTRGTNSGDGRTNPKNTGCHKLCEFETAVRLYGPDRAKQYENWIEDWKLGDDQACGFDDPRWFKEEVATMQSYGWEVDGKECKFDELEFVSTAPRFITLDSGEKLIVPCVNSSKVIASLADKKKTDDPEIDFARITSAKILCFFTEDYQTILEVEKMFLHDFPKFRTHGMYISDQEILTMYVGSFESLSNKQRELVPIVSAFFDEDVVRF